MSAPAPVQPLVRLRGPENGRHRSRNIEQPFQHLTISHLTPSFSRAWKRKQSGRCKASAANSC